MLATSCCCCYSWTWPKVQSNSWCRRRQCRRWSSRRTTAGIGCSRFRRGTGRRPVSISCSSCSYSRLILFPMSTISTFSLLACFFTNHLYIYASLSLSKSLSVPIPTSLSIPLGMSWPPYASLYPKSLDDKTRKQKKQRAEIKRNLENRNSNNTPFPCP